MYLFRLIIRFSNMGTEWGGYHLHLRFESLLPSSSSIWAILMSLTFLMGYAQFASLSVERTNVVRHSYFVYSVSPFLFGCRHFADVSSRYNVAKGPISFGAAHLRFCSAWFVLLLLLSLVTTKLLYIHFSLQLIMG
jgi:hypothetical protein